MAVLVFLVRGGAMGPAGAAPGNLPSLRPNHLRLPVDMPPELRLERLE